jgi:hypothetical protein
MVDNVPNPPELLFCIGWQTQIKQSGFVITTSGLETFGLPEVQMTTTQAKSRDDIKQLLNVAAGASPARSAT